MGYTLVTAKGIRMGGRRDQPVMATKSVRMIVYRPTLLCQFNEDLSNFPVGIHRRLSSSNALCIWA